MRIACLEAYVRRRRAFSGNAVYTTRFAVSQTTECFQFYDPISWGNLARVGAALLVGGIIPRTERVAVARVYAARGNILTYHTVRYTRMIDDSSTTQQRRTDEGHIKQPEKIGITGTVLRHFGYPTLSTLGET